MNFSELLYLSGLNPPQAELPEALTTALNELKDFPPKTIALMSIASLMVGMKIIRRALGIPPKSYKYLLLKPVHRRLFKGVNQ